jgi:hypothetical protein
LVSKEIDHRDGESSKDQRNDSKVSFRFGERIEHMGNHEEKGSLEIIWVIFIKLDLAFEIISGIFKSINFIEPEGFLIESVESQGKSYNET